MLPMPPDFGLCAYCRHAKLLRSKGGGAILFCGLSKDDPRFPRYPPLPVTACDGYPNSAG